jgi:hypothetical protein
VERALQVSAGVENITAKSTPKKAVFVTASPYQDGSCKSCNSQTISRNGMYSISAW